MAVYKLSGGAFQRVGEDLQALVPAVVLETPDLHAVLRAIGFLLSDDIDDSVMIFRRNPAGGAVHYLPGVRWVFVVFVDGDVADFVLVGDSLPDYLEMLSQLQPVINRRREIAAAVLAELS